MTPGAQLSPSFTPLPIDYGGPMPISMPWMVSDASPAEPELRNSKEEWYGLNDVNGGKQRAGKLGTSIRNLNGGRRRTMLNSPLHLNSRSS